MSALLAGCKPAAQESSSATGPTAVPPTGQRISPATPSIPSPLQSLLETEARQIEGQVSLHLRVDGGPEAGVRADAPMPAASVIKLPLMAVLEDAWAAGMLRRSDHDAERMRKMITVSDNPAANALIGRLGVARVNAWLRRHECADTRLLGRVGVTRGAPQNTVTAAEMTRLLLQIARGELVSPAASAEMRTTLLAQKRRSRIPAGLPAEAVCGNKTGTLRGVVNDVAFVEGPNGLRYALAVLVSGADGDKKTSREIAALSRTVYETLTAAHTQDKK